MNLSTFNIFKNLPIPEGMIEISGETLLNLQKTLLEILKDVDKVCKKNNIKYFLSGGSMLGAVRHNGFIPWDDDIDIFMTRENYDKFNEIFDKELSDKYYNQIPNVTHNYGNMAGKIRKKGTILLGREDIDSDEAGVWIDIFVLENTYDNALLRKLHCFLSMASGLCLSCRMFETRKDIYLQLAGDNKEIKKVFKTKILIGKCLSFFSLDRWAKITNGIYSMCKNTNSKYVVCPAGRGHFTGEIYPRYPFVETQTHQFEDMQTYISKWYDGYLSQLYGDYMSIPKEENRECHVVRKLKL